MDRVKAIESEPSGVKGRPDARAKEKAEAQKVVEDLKQQMSSKSVNLRRRRSDQRVIAKAIESERLG